MQDNLVGLTQKARTWFNKSLFNRDVAGEYFEYLLDGIDPMWSAVTFKARVLGVLSETADTKTWVLRPHRSWTGHKPGQHAHLTFTINGVRQTRTFTISSPPALWEKKRTITITVKKVKNGRVTGWMHDALDAGTVIELSAAQGDFIPDPAHQRVGYIAAGSGITPIMSQIREGHIRRNTIESTLLYFANTRQDFIFGKELAQITEANSRHQNLLVATYDDSGEAPLSDLPQGQIESAHIKALLKTRPEVVYVCGPHPFREAAKSLLAESGFDLDNVREEAFGLPPTPAVEGDAAVVAFSDSGIETTASSGTLLEIAESAGLNPTSGCRMGICYTCKCTKKSGQVRNLLTGELSSPDAEDIQICVSTPVGKVELEL